MIREERHIKMTLLKSQVSDSWTAKIEVLKDEFRGVALAGLIVRVGITGASPQYSIRILTTRLTLQW